MDLRSFLKKHPWAAKVHAFCSMIISKVKWPRTMALFNGGLYYSLTEDDHDTLRRLLKDYYCVVLTRRKCHLTSYLISALSWLATRRCSHYTHSLMNVEGDIKNHMDFKLIEATGPGVHYSTFMEVFDCDSVCVLKPRNVSLTEWTLVMDAVKASYGSQYDMLFDITEEQKVSCVELIYKGIKRLPDWQVRFANLIKLIEDHKADLTPQMLLDSGDFDVVFEVRR